MTRLFHAHVGASGRQLERQDWRTPLTQALAERSGVEGPIPLTLALKVAAAMECLNLSIAYWAAADGEIDLVDLLEEGFAMLGDEDARAEQTRRRRPAAARRVRPSGWERSDGDGPSPLG